MARKVKAGKDAPLDPDSKAAKQSVHAEVKEAKREVSRANAGVPSGYDPATADNHSHLNP